MNVKNLIDKRVCDYYWKDNINCAMTTLKILGEIFSIDLAPQVLNLAIDLSKDLPFILHKLSVL